MSENEAVSNCLTDNGEAISNSSYVKFIQSCRDEDLERIKREYDLCFSLGGNCSVAHNLKIRRLRPFSLPLDWTYMIDDRPLEWLVNSIGKHMEGFCEKCNLVEILPGHPECNNAHNGHRKYIDKLTGYRFINHFSDAVPEDRAYEDGIAVIRKRVERLFCSFERYKRFLMILGVGFPVRTVLLTELKAKLEILYPNKVFDVELVEFNAPDCGDMTVSPGVRARRFQRDWNTYDCEGKNYEWKFLDNVVSAIKPKKKRKISFHIWPHIKCVTELHRT